MPKKVSSEFILRLIDKGALVFTGDRYENAVRVVESLKPKQIALFPSRFRIKSEESNLIIKSLSDLVKIDSRGVLRNISGQEEIPTRLTRGFLEAYQKWPRSYIRRAVDDCDIENPPIGFYWMGADNHPRGTTWLRSATAAEMEAMREKGFFPEAEVEKKPYGRNIRAVVVSRTEEGKSHTYSWTRIPTHKRGSIKQYSSWLDIACSSDDPDMIFRGEEHDKRAFPINFFSAGAIFSLYESMRLTAEHPELRQFRVNVFPIPSNTDTADYIDNLRLRSLILDRDKEGCLSLFVLNKTEIDKNIGARTRLRGYNNCWYHWGKRDISYLFQPEK